MSEWTGKKLEFERKAPYIIAIYPLQLHKSSSLDGASWADELHFDGFIGTVEFPACISYPIWDTSNWLIL